MTVTNTSDLIDYFVLQVFVWLVLPLSIFVCVMLTFFVDWDWIPLSSKDRERGNSLEDLKNKLLE